MSSRDGRVNVSQAKSARPMQETFGRRLHSGISAEVATPDQIGSRRLRLSGKLKSGIVPTSAAPAPDQIQVDLHSSAIAELLSAALTIGAPTIVIVKACLHLKRTGRALRLVHNQGGGAQTPSVDAGIVKLLLKGQRWWAQLREADCEIGALARKEGVTASYMTRVVQLALRQRGSAADPHQHRATHIAGRGLMSLRQRLEDIWCGPRMPRLYHLLTLHCRKLSGAVCSSAQATERDR